MPPTRRRRTACGTCVRRKVKCDETHPVCNRCKKGKFVCEGYEPKIVFVEENPAGSSSAAASRSRSISQEREVSESESSVMRASPNPSSSMDLTAWQANIAVAFTMENLFKQQEQGLYQGTESPARSWLELAIGRGSSEISMDSAIGALCMAYFGKRHHQLSLVTQANVRYGRALMTLNQSLSDPERAKSLETLRDTMALLVYEVVVFTDPQNWMRHADGMSRLFQLRGPDSFRDPLALHILLSCRMIIILQCLVARKRCFLEEPAWQEVPGMLIPGQRSLLMEIQDILCYLPGLLSELTELRTSVLSPEDLQIRSGNLYKSIVATMSLLFQWRWKWQAQNPWSAYSIPVKTSKAVPYTPFKSVIYFDCLESANCVVIYGGAFVSLYEIAEGLLGQGEFSLAPALEDARQNTLVPVPEIPREGSLLTLPHEAQNPEMIALEMCAMIDFHFEEAHRGMGVFIALWPLKLAQRVLARRPAIYGWVKIMIERIALEDALEVVRAPLDMGL